MTEVLAVDEPVVGRASGPLGAVQAADREISRQTALRARAIAAFAATCPASADRQPGEPGAMAAERWAARAEVLRPVSEWAAHELAIALNVTTQRAEEELARSLTLVHRLPGALDALQAGVLHPGHLWCLLEHVAPIADHALRARIEAELLGWLGGRSVTTPAQLGDKVRRVVLKHAARDAARHLARALRRRGVSARPDRTAGMSVVSALLTTPEAAALLAALGACADALPADTRSRGQKMADCLLDLVLRPGETGRPPVQVALTVVAPVGALLGGDAPCEIDGQVVPAEVVRALLAALTGQANGTESVEPDTAPADTAPADTAPADTAPADTAPAGPEPHDRAGTSAVVSEAEDFARWSEELEQRVLAGEFDAEPAPCYLDEDGPPPDPWPPDPWPVGSTARYRSAPAVPDGWWARADRAVDDAGTALLTLQRTLGHARRLVATAQRADAADEATGASSAAGQVSAAPDALTALAAAADQARADLADLLARTAGGGLADRPRLALTHTLGGALLALTDLPALQQAARTGTGLTAPGESPGYRPAAALDRFVRARDRRCRFPGCRRPVPRRGELDHHTPWPAGATAAANLAGYCTGHHRSTAPSRVPP